MASFAQTQAQTFTPYIPKYNTELYIQMGMARQQEYDQNLEKVQSAVATVAGMRVANEADQKYIETKVSELRSNLQTMSGSDFSQKQVFNRAGGYISQLSTDKNIQNAVMSTANIQKDMEAIKTATKDGKAAASNTHHLTKKIRNYTTNQEVGQQYSEQGYTPYYNRGEAFAKSYKDKNPNVSVDWNTTSYNADGTPNFRAYTIENNERKYIDPSSVASDYQTWLQSDMQAQQQLSFDAEYYSDNTSNEAAATILKNSNDATMADFDQSLASYSQIIANSSGDKKEQAQSYYNKVLEQKSLLQQEYRTAVEDLEKDPDSFKRRSYAQSVMAGEVRRYSYSETKKELKENPEFKMYMKEQAHNLALSKFSEEQRQNEIRNRFTERTVSLAERKEKAELGQSTMFVEGKASAGDNPIKTFNDYGRQLDMEGAEIAVSQLQLVGSLEDAEPAGEQSKRITVYDPTTGQYRLRNENISSDAITAKYNNAKIAYNEDPNQVSDVARSYFSSDNGARDYAYAARRLSYDQAKKEVEATMSGSQEYKDYQSRRKEFIDNYTIPGDKFEVGSDGVTRLGRNKVEEFMDILLAETFDGKGMKSAIDKFNARNPGESGGDISRAIARFGGQSILSFNSSGKADANLDEITNRFVSTIPNKTMSVNLKDAKSTNQLGLVTDLMVGQTTGEGNKGNVEQTLKSVKNPISINYTRRGATNDFTVQIIGEDGTRTEPMNITPENLVRLGQGALIQDEQGSKYTNAFNANSSNLDSRVRNTTKGGLPPILNANTPTYEKYNMQGWIKRNENDGTYQLIIKYRDKTTPGSTWKEVNVPTTVTTYGSPEAAEQGIRNLYGLSPESFENAVLK